MASNKSSLLWQITPANQPPSYLFGTMHIRDQRAFSHIEELQTYIQQCPSFATEVPFDQLDQHLFFHQLQLPPGTTLDQLVPSKRYQKMRAIILKATQVDIHTLRHLQPVLIVQLLSSQLLQSEWAVALDEALWQFAEQQQKQLLGLESLESQITLLQRIPMEQQVKSLKEVAKNISTFRKGLLHAADTYQSGDLRQIYRAAKRSTRGMRKKLLYNRNIQMAQQMADYMTEAPIFCAVGAGHLAGAKGMLRLLKQKGFRVKAVSLSA
ncbi:MAG: TraB/GumN family protein [Bacteroidota bacterium]